VKAMNKVTVIMPVWNTPKHLLTSSVEGVLGQTYNNLHLIIINDGSIDKDTNEYLKDLAKQSLKNVDIFNKENGGPSSARNMALAMIPEGDLIAFCDADDVWKKDHLIESVKYLDSADMVYSNPFLQGTDGIEMIPSFALYDNFNAKRLKLGNFIYISTVVCRNVIGEFDSNLDKIEDYDYWVRAVSNGLKIVQKPSTTVTYNIQEGSFASGGHKKLEILHKKHPEFFTLRLNLGSGAETFADFINVDMVTGEADVKMDCTKISLQDNSVDEIRAYHLIEHFHFFKGVEVLKEWHRILKPNGRLHLETPDLLGTCREFIDASEPRRIQLYGHFFAFPWEEGNAHFFLYTESQLFWTLDQIGFKNIKRLIPDSTYVPGQSHDLFLNVEAFK
jgi:GT2 family glycosyltransferase